MKKALKIGIMGMIGFMLFVYGGLNGYCLAWSRLYDRGNYIGCRRTFLYCKVYFQTRIC